MNNTQKCPSTLQNVSRIVLTSATAFMFSCFGIAAIICSLRGLDPQVALALVKVIF